MAEAQPPPPAGTPARKRGGLPPKILGLPTPVVLAGGAALTALGLLWWRSRHAAAAAAGAASTSTTASTASTSTTEEAQIQGLEQELAQLMAEQQGGAAGGGAAGGTAGTGGGATGTTGGTPGTSKGTTATASPPAAPARTSPWPAPVLGAFTPSASGVIIRWARVPGSGGQMYHYQVEQQANSDLVNDDRTTALSASVQGLKSKTAYRARVSIDPQGLWSGWKTFTTT